MDQSLSEKKNKKNRLILPEQPIVSLTSDISLGFAIASMEDKGLIMEAVVSLLKNKF